MSPCTTLRHPVLSIVIPLFNEEESLPLTIAAIFQVLDNNPDFLELVLVDDGSRDKTAALAQEFASKDPRIRLVRHERNRGLGAAIRTGLAAAEGELVLYTDADLPFDFRLIPQLVALAKPNQIVIGCRQNRGEGGRRWLLSKGYNLLCRLALGVWVKDVNFACKLLPRLAVRHMNLQAEGSFIDAEMLLECRRLGFEIAEMPMTYYPRTVGESTLSRPRVVWVILEEMFRYFLRNAFAHYEIAEEANSQRR
ncbi:MAG TPA: glycosyltransferase family 2 protein [Blastocatellia bacterium]|nr:glycosyltransferase family 2 protein [Blastocatellia bacterium]